MSELPGELDGLDLGIVEVGSGSESDACLRWALDEANVLQA